MTSYAKYMQHIHNQAIAASIEAGVSCIIEDVVELLLSNGVKPHGEILNKIRKLQKYEYGKIAPINNESCKAK